MTRQTLYGLVAVVVVAVLTGVWFVNNYEYRPVRKFVGYQGESRHNPLMAARRYLRRMGIDARRYAPIMRDTRLPLTRDVIVLGTNRLTITEPITEKLFTWVRAGGRLVVFARNEIPDDGANTVEDKLLDALGITVRYLDLENREQTQYGPFGVSIFNADDFIWAGLNPEFRLIVNERPGVQILAGDNKGAAVVARSMGQGDILVLSDRRIFNNGKIDDEDHATLLWWLVRGDRPAGKAWLVHEDDMPALYAWLWERASLMVLSIAVFIALLLWGHAPRFGPVIGLAPPLRRRLVEHIDASAHYLWRKRQSGRLILAVQNALKRELSRRHPGTHDPAHLSTITGIAKNTISSTMRVNTTTKRETFLGVVRLYQNVYKKL